jgi:hypothetical protein
MRVIVSAGMAGTGPKRNDVAQGAGGGDLWDKVSKESQG